MRRNKQATTTTTADVSARREEGFWIAVLPFKYSGSNADLSALAEGLSEDIVTGLSRFSYLKVIARSSTSRFASESVDVRTAGKELGARYVMEGSLRTGWGRSCVWRCSSLIRLQAPIFGPRTMNAAFSPEALFELQDDLVPRIVSTVADMHGVLPRSMSELCAATVSGSAEPVRGPAAQLRLLRAAHRRKN